MIKLQRAGFTETDLIFIDSLPKEKITQDLRELWLLDINRLYSQSGFYDKEIYGSYRDIDTEQAESSNTFRRWLLEYRNSLLNSDYLILMSHIYSQQKYFLYKDMLNIYSNRFNQKNSINKNFYRYWKDNYAQSIYPYLEDKNVLVINSFGSIIQHQYDSKNIYRIFPSFPKIRNLKHIDFPYTFFNDGPHKNYFETLDYYFEIISQIEFDIALVSCGSYGCILVDRIVSLLSKSAITLGSGITPMFGIDPNKKEQYWVNEIPKEYIPNNYEKIDKGRYWIGTK